jgi:hypothetical protein
MSSLKFFNPNTGKWEYAAIGKTGATGPQGPTGLPGVVAQPNQPSDPAVVWIDTDDTASPLVPTGGTAGQSLVKRTGNDYDTVWVDNLSGTIDGGAVSSVYGGTVNLDFGGVT